MGIPLPKSGAEVLDEGVSRYLQNLMQRKLQERQLAQQQAYQQGELGIQRAAGQRAEQLLPYQIAELKAKELKARNEQNLYNQIFGQQGNAIAPSDLNQNKINQSDQNASSQQNIPAEKKKSFADIQKELESGNEVLISPGDPGKFLWDKAPGSTIMGIKIPDIKSNVVNGIRYDRYPSGKTVGQKVGLSEEEKSKIGLDVAQEKEQAKANVKESTDLIDTGKMLSDYSDHIEALSNLYDKKKHVSGLLSGIRNKIKLGSPEAAIFMSHSTPMVGKLGRDIAQKGGAYVSSLAQAGKPDIYQNDEFNKSMINEQAKGFYKSYQRAKERYEALNPTKKYPVKLPQFYDKVRIKAPNGLTYIKTQKEAEALEKKYPGSQILGNIYE